MPRLVVIVASTRPGRVGRKVADWFIEQAAANGTFEIEVVDLAELALPFVDEPNHPVLRQYTKQHTLEWSAKVDAAEAFVFVMPEYNFAFNAPLKNAIDFLFHEWHYKPVGFVSYGGISGGLRAVQMMKQVVTAVKMFPLYEAVSISFVRKRIAESGVFEADDTLTAMAATMLTELHRVAVGLTALRRSITVPGN
jgi:NAD(P)H-dependent FMN reductase